MEEDRGALSFWSRVTLSFQQRRRINHFIYLYALLYAAAMLLLFYNLSDLLAQGDRIVLLWRYNIQKGNRERSQAVESLRENRIIIRQGV